MGSTPSKTKPGARTRDRRPPAKKPPPPPNATKKTNQYGDNIYYTPEMVNGHHYDARDAFLEEDLYPTSDPFPRNPAHSHNDEYEREYGRSNQNFPHLRTPPEREIIVQQPRHEPYHGPLESGSHVPYTYTYSHREEPQQPVRNIEAREGEVRDDVISVQVGPDSKTISTQTEPPRIRDRHYSRVPVLVRVPPPHARHHRNYRTQSELRHMPRDRDFPPRHTSLSEQYGVSNRQDYSNTAVSSLIPHRREVVIPPSQLQMPPQQNSIPPQITVPQQTSTAPPGYLAMPQQVSTVPPQASVFPQRESVLPYQESVIPQREPIRKPQESVMIQHVYLPPKADANLRFYRNEIRFRPDGIFIDDIHKHWYGDYDRLENDHTYIQWLFPLPESSAVNNEAQPLKQHEIGAMLRDKVVVKRLLKSYMLMLDFYGISLSDREFGKLQRALNYKSRFANLNTSSHNYPRITRMIRSMGLLGLKHYQLPLVMFLLYEVLITTHLSNVRDSNLEHWIDAIIDQTNRKTALEFYMDNRDRHRNNSKAKSSQVTLNPRESNKTLQDESMVFSERHEFEDIDDDEFRDTSLPLMKSHSSIDTDGLTEIPPLNLGLLSSRRSP